MNLSNKMLAVLVAPKFDDTELLETAAYFSKSGVDVRYIGIFRGTCKGKVKEVAEVQTLVNEVNPSDFDGLFIPGGGAPETLRLREDVLSFVRDFVNNGKPVGAICHGPQVLISAKVVKDRNMTCNQGIRDDLKNAGAIYQDEEVVVDRNLVTSRSIPDLPYFLKAFREILANYDRNAAWAKASPPEILEFAIYNEIKAFELYDTLAGQAKNGVTQAKFQLLAAMEKNHREILTEVFGKLTGGKIPQPKLLDLPMGEACREIDPKADLRKILQGAMENEEAAYHLYRGIADRIPHSEGKKLFTQLAEEELQHKQILDTEYAQRTMRPMPSALEKEPWWSEDTW